MCSYTGSQIVFHQYDAAVGGGVGRVDDAGVGGPGGDAVRQCLFHCPADRAAQFLSLAKKYTDFSELTTPIRFYFFLISIKNPFPCFNSFYATLVSTKGGVDYDNLNKIHS